MTIGTTVPSDWRPIETAPRDGSIIDLTWMEDGAPAEIWRMRYDPEMRNGMIPGAQGFWVTPGREMTWHEGDDGGPTHWRPVGRMSADERAPLPPWALLGRTDVIRLIGRLRKPAKEGEP